ncbi:Por secretion system C-terminal sorting domain-containing protein [Flavobacterium sp. CF108]|uniref:T9SS type A sorting domain-containing protein n=1 Tax=unclassified Flavobacterium TaxID=196869 RepID=UPI0008C1C775|nr:MULTISPECIES: T9SS type A sorting domain-containing protein [unclassified Flavobacterium]SEO80320.1 Por secretion system C-terminal sorting domain-containing protein [Flavobacterium sp. fv08]SHG75149.1 Por secretion system C-terminal sorting domain-containing protein [Flavobacterium sp. CF108]
MNKIKLSLVCAVLLSGISTYAIDGNEDFNLHVLKNGKMITFGLNQTQKAKLAIYDTDGTLLYSENASGKDGILRTFSLQEFPDGVYFLEVEDNAKKVRYEINVNNEIATLSSKAISSVYKTVSDKNTSVAVR